MRAWLGILHDRHPEVAWVPAQEVEAEEPSSEIEVTTRIQMPVTVTSS